MKPHSLTHFVLELRGLVFYSASWTFMAMIVGALSGSASAFFLWALDQCTNTRLAHPWLLALLPLAGAAVAWIYLKYGSSVEAGNNLLIDEIHDPQKMIPLRMAPFVLGGTLVSHLVGASVGREGTAVQMGGALADQLTRLFKLTPENRRILLMSGLSAGFASIFGVPLAGALFGLEVLAIGRLRYEALFPCLIAAVAADQVCLAWGAHHTHYVAGVIPALTVWTMAATLIAGALFGLAGMAFARSTHALTALLKQIFPYSPLRALGGGAVFALVMWVTHAERYLGLGVPVIVEAFQHPVLPWDFLAKGAATVWSLASGFKGGEVTPLFYVGATLGNVIAPLLHMPIGLFAALGLVAVFAGAANTPIASAVMAVELFGGEIGVYAAGACVMAWLFSGNTGIYKAQRPGEGKWRRHHTIAEGK
ncbi:H+/Cl- antiporter ClcA [Silvimonas terrae]|uniref:H+/Cl- antiporter ClcA n=1 Tax=Silvimonas terrae TaxID=300266 RepID=A0A840RIK1_9NEIS|nr:voltage-gated chloride channel family protein [Silvimonas terrae]MBB5192136.1 H+/Cl- antiporter ClcA [Silvimonas terrae]